MCIVALRGACSAPKHIIAQMNATQLAWLEPQIEGFPKQAFVAAVKRNDVAAAEFIWMRRKLYPNWDYTMDEIPTMTMYKWLRDHGFNVISPELYWCHPHHISTIHDALAEQISLIAARPDSHTIPMHPRLASRVRIANAIFTHEDADAYRYIIWHGPEADRAIELGVATMSNVANLSTSAAIALTEKYIPAPENLVQMLRWDDDANAWMDSQRHKLQIKPITHNKRALKWLARDTRSHIYGDLPIRYGSVCACLAKIKTIVGVQANTKNWLCETRKGAARLREIIDVLKCTWSNAQLLNACRFVDHVTWGKMYKNKIKRRHIAHILQYGNLDLLAHLHTTVPGLFDNTAYLLSHIRHARTWRWLTARGYTSRHIHLDLDPKPCLIVAFHRANQSYTVASKSAWLARLQKTLATITHV